MPRNLEKILPCRGQHDPPVHTNNDFDPILPTKRVLVKQQHETALDGALRQDVLAAIIQKSTRNTFSGGVPALRGVRTGEKSHIHNERKATY